MKCFHNRNNDIYGYCALIMRRPRAILTSYTIREMEELNPNQGTARRAGRASPPPSTFRRRRFERASRGAGAPDGPEPRVCDPLRRRGEAPRARAARARAARAAAGSSRLQQQQAAEGASSSGRSSRGSGRRVRLCRKAKRAVRRACGAGQQRRCRCGEVRAAQSGAVWAVGRVCGAVTP